ncbi:hypothetical protein GGR53DRAFT_461562 [Hypoxylon sp. FL1150]|nr:hypothetical protein GGR53DRAFT_461562 [Hypoxylon sp. FL1150]
MLFSKLCLATSFLAGALAAPLPSSNHSEDYSIGAYSTDKRDLPTATTATVVDSREDAAAKRAEAGTEGGEDSVIAYLVGKRGEAGAEYSPLVYLLDKE